MQPDPGDGRCREAGQKIGDILSYCTLRHDCDVWSPQLKVKVSFRADFEDSSPYHSLLSSTSSLRPSLSFQDLPSHTIHDIRRSKDLPSGRLLRYATMARRTRTKRALLCAFVGLSCLSCFADAQNVTYTPGWTNSTLSRKTASDPTRMATTTVVVTQTEPVEVHSTVTSSATATVVVTQTEPVEVPSTSSPLLVVAPKTKTISTTLSVVPVIGTDPMPEPAGGYPPEYYNEDSKELSGKLMEVVTERCYAEAIHRQLVSLTS